MLQCVVSDGGSEGSPKELWRLSEDGLYRLICLKTWLPDGEAVCEGLSGMNLLEEVGRWVRALRFQKPSTVPGVLSCACGSNCELSFVLQP